ncbi:MAG: pilus assembly protein TadG-related protein [Rhodospirillales bacterium]
MKSRLDRIWNGITRLARRLRVDRRGAIAVFLAFAIVPMIGFVGIATDTARAYLVKSRLSSALDAAALAGGLAMFKRTRDADIQMYFNANFPPGYMDSTVSGPQITADPASETITLTASATIPTSFMRVFGHETISVTGMAEATRKMTALDVVLAIDMSGSMNSSAAGGGTRIAAARRAATDLINILFGSDSSKARLNIGLVPWNGKVNVTIDGTVFDPALTTTQAVPAFVNPEDPSPNPASPPPPNPQSQVFFANNSPVPLLEAPPAGWRGAVYNRFIDDNDPNNDADILYGPVNLLGADWVAWQPVGPEGEPVPGGARCALAIGNRECTPTLRHGITPLQNQKQVILDAVAALRRPRGVTNIPGGLGWAWRALKPAAPFTEAVANPDYERDQAIVLLTDGANYGGSGDGYKGTFGRGSTARPDMNARLLELAGNIKADGVIIYVIQFAYNNSSLQTLLQTVASGPRSPYYHFAPDATALRHIFRQIADHLSALRLSK